MSEFQHLVDLNYGSSNPISGYFLVKTNIHSPCNLSLNKIKLSLSLLYDHQILNNLLPALFYTQLPRFLHMILSN